MTTRSQQTNPGRWLLPFLAALVGVLALIGLAGTASANERGVSQNRVGAISRAVEVLVEPPQHETAGQHPGRAADSAETVVATAVAAKGGDGLIDASKVRFTQDSAGSTFSDGGSVLDLANGMAKTGKAPAGLPPIRLFEQNGKLYSLDNRRLFAGQYAGAKLPYRMATPGEIAARNQTQIFDGTSIMIRFPGGRGNWGWWQQ
jgi:hypothetical protein